MSTASDQYFLGYVKKLQGGGTFYLTPTPNRNRGKLSMLYIYVRITFIIVH